MSVNLLVAKKFMYIYVVFVDVGYRMILTFTGSSKTQWWLVKEQKKQVVPKKIPHALENGLVPLPAKVCFTCNKCVLKSIGFKNLVHTMLSL